MALSCQVQRMRQYLKNRSDVRQIIGNTGWLFSDRVFRLLVTLIVGSWLARYLGTQRYGQLNIAQAYIVLLMPVLKMGMDSVIVRSIVNEPSEKYQILGSALIIRLLVGLLVLPFMLAILFLMNPADRILNVLVGLLAIGAFVQSFEVIDFWFQSQVESKYTVYARMLSFVATSILKVLAILFSAPLLVFGFLLLLDMLLYIGALITVYKRSGGQLLHWSFQIKQAKQLLKTSWPLIIAGLAVSAYMRIDQLMLSQMIRGAEGQQAVGIYASAVRIAEAWYFVPTAIVSSVFPAILKTKKESLLLYQKRLQRLFNLVVLISYTVAIPTTFIASWLIDILYGADFADAALLLIILVWSGVWVSLGVARSAVLLAENRLQFSMWSTGIGAVTNIVLNFLLIPKLGVLGCAIATLLAQAVAAHITTLLYAPVSTIGILQTRALFYPNPIAYRKPN